MSTDDQQPEKANPERPSLLSGWLSRAAVAAEIGVSTDTLQRWETRRIGPPCLRIGRRVYYRAEAFRDWLISRERAARASRPRHARAGIFQHVAADRSKRVRGVRLGTRAHAENRAHAGRDRPHGGDLHLARLARTGRRADRVDARRGRALEADLLEDRIVAPARMATVGRSSVPDRDAAQRRARAETSVAVGKPRRWKGGVRPPKSR